MGSESILPYSYLGMQGTINGLSVGDAFFHKLGATVSERTFCDSGATSAYIMTLGDTVGLDPESIVHSKDYIEKYTEGYTELKARVQEYPPARVSVITGLPEMAIVQLSREYADSQPAAIRIGVGIERSSNGGQADPHVVIHPDDAATRSISNGQRVRIITITALFMLSLTLAKKLCPESSDAQQAIGTI